MKTNAARLLDTLGIRYALRDYDVDEDDLSAESVARKVGLPPERVFKTLVVRAESKAVLLALVAAHHELDLKALARVAGEKKVDTVPLKDVQPLTGYIRGGVTALGCRKPYPVIVDASFVSFETVAVSAGIRGTQLVLDPNDYVRATSARSGPIGRPKPA